MCWSFCTEKSHFSPPLRHHLRTRDHHHPADDQRHGQVPRHAQQRQGVHEASRGEKASIWSTELGSVPGAEDIVRESDGLRGVDLGDDEGDRPGEGRETLMLNIRK